MSVPTFTAEQLDEQASEVESWIAEPGQSPTWRQIAAQLRFAARLAERTTHTAALCHDSIRKSSTLISRQLRRGDDFNDALDAERRMARAVLDTLLPEEPR